MTHRIACYTLFDTTQTGILNRSKPNNDVLDDWLHKRSTQCNFDTILQVISLRSQPEVIKFPTKVSFLNEADFDRFGFLYKTPNFDNMAYWKFEFEVQHSSVFENGIIPLGALYNDCSGVPMVLCKTQIGNIPAFLNTSAELKNIHFEVI